MKELIKRAFGQRRDTPEAFAMSHSGDTHSSSELTSSDIENYYLQIIGNSLRRMLVPSDAVKVSVKPAGIGPKGRKAFAGYVRILKWDAVLTPVLLQNVPVIDAQVRRNVEASVLLEGTHFSGIWFQANAQTEGAPRDLMGLPAELVHQPGGQFSAA